tara:strand:+ start:47 stop:223 length:177 start_codon:yes stop_codon:yes gene_type:complete
MMDEPSLPTALLVCPDADGRTEFSPIVFPPNDNFVVDGIVIIEPEYALILLTNSLDMF